MKDHIDNLKHLAKSNVEINMRRYVEKTSDVEQKLLNMLKDQAMAGGNSYRDCLGNAIYILFHKTRSNMKSESEIRNEIERLSKINPLGSQVLACKIEASILALKWVLNKADMSDEVPQQKRYCIKGEGTWEK